MTCYAQNRIFDFYLHKLIKNFYSFSPVPIYSLAHLFTVLLFLHPVHHNNLSNCPRSRKSPVKIPETSLTFTSQPSSQRSKPFVPFPGHRRHPRVLSKVKCNKSYKHFCVSLLFLRTNYFYLSSHNLTNTSLVIDLTQTFIFRGRRINHFNYRKPNTAN